MEKIIPKFVPITPAELYTQRVNSTYDGIRKSARIDYTPLQFGGLFGQQMVLTTNAILELTDYEVS